MTLPKSIWSWAYYDFANSSYVLVYAALLLPVFFATMYANTGHSLGAWGVANALATAIGLVISIIIGRYSDKHGKFKSFKYSILISFIGMMTIALAVKFWIGSVYYFYIFTQSFFILSISLSDSILPHIASKKDSSEYSGFAWGFGYLGGVAALVIAIILQKITGNEYHPLVFASTAIFYMLFSIYSLRGLKKVKMNEKPPVTQTSILTKSQKNILLLGYWFISEGITVILLFITIYLKNELGFSNMKIGATLLAVQSIAFPATWYGGKLARRFDIVKLLGVTVILWGITVAFLTFNLGLPGLIVIIIAGAFTLGNSQSYLRSQYANLIERSESGFQFGLYTVASEAAVFIGPIIYGLASDYFKSQRIPLICLFITMVLGYILIWKITKNINIKTGEIWT
ncbi:MAG: MFS transporter [Candidatus Moranbacteria bacterium]|nr:MFS transporter [Candidatus Moranbacteria bacterium]